MDLSVNDRYCTSHNAHFYTAHRYHSSQQNVHTCRYKWVAEIYPILIQNIFAFLRSPDIRERERDLFFASLARVWAYGGCLECKGPISYKRERERERFIFRRLSPVVGIWRLPQVQHVAPSTGRLSCRPEAFLSMVQ